MYSRTNRVIQQATSDFGAESTNVQYVAHAIMSDGSTVRINDPTTGTGLGSNPTYHPDRQFWAQRNPLTLQKLRDKSARNATIDHIEIDCTLMPCDTAPNACLYTIPKQIPTEYGNVELWIFSHRNQGMGGAKGKDGLPKRYIRCFVNSSNVALDEAMEANGGWDWA